MSTGNPECAQALGQTACVNITRALGSSPYPGRGLIIGRSDEGLFGIYFLTGRTAASRQRRLVASCTNLSVESTTSGQEDELRHYRAAGLFGRHLIVGNGRHVDELGGKAGDIPDARVLSSLDPEPDAPIHTARIAAIIDLESQSLLVGAARRTPHGSTDHIGVSTDDVRLGTGILIATYVGPVAAPRTWAAPTWIDVESSLEAQASSTWDALDSELRVGLASCVLGSAWSVKLQA